MLLLLFKSVAYHLSSNCDTHRELHSIQLYIFTGMMNWLVRMTAELEVSMNSVERLVEYNSMESEAAAIIEDKRPALDWPSQGVIKVENLIVRYRPELPPVISNLSFESKAREKVRRIFDLAAP